MFENSHHFPQSDIENLFRQPWWLISNYWMRLSRIWRILPIKESRVLTPSEICRILRMNSWYKAETAMLFVFLLTKNNTTSSPGFLGLWFNNLQRAALLMSLVQSDKIHSKFGKQQLVMVNYASHFNQSEAGKYFEWITISTTKCQWHVLLSSAHLLLITTQPSCGFQSYL